jgi:cell division protein FtsL
MSIEVVFEKRINNANVLRDVDVAQRRQYFLVTFLSAMFVLGLLLYGWQQYRWLRLGYDIEKLKEKKEKLVEDQHSFQLEWSLWASAQYINDQARERLGMGVAAPGQIVTVSVDDLNPTAPTTDVAVVH